MRRHKNILFLVFLYRFKTHALLSLYPGRTLDFSFCCRTKTKFFFFFNNSFWSPLIRVVNPRFFSTSLALFNNLLSMSSKSHSVVCFLINFFFLVVILVYNFCWCRDRFGKIDGTAGDMILCFRVIWRWFSPHIFFVEFLFFTSLCTGLVPVVNMSGVVALSVGGRWDWGGYPAGGVVAP